MAKKITRISVRKGATLQVFRLGKTANRKIAEEGEVIVQTYTFSMKQFNYVAECVRNVSKTEFKKFFMLADTNCLDCPYSMTKQGGCYTHKYMQFAGFVSMLKSIISQYETFSNIPEYNSTTKRSLMLMAAGKYVRFGSYGEPVLIPKDIVDGMVSVSSSHTGYSHQWKKPEFVEYKAYFMQSAHNQQEVEQGNTMDWRAFVSAKETWYNAEGKKLQNRVHCPASKEKGFKTACSKCSLCNGNKNKTKLNVEIIEH